jgi:hypothetical protein
MKNEEQMELMVHVKALCDSVVSLTGRMMVLHSKMDAIASLQRRLLVRAGDDPKAVDAAYAKAMSDAFDKETEIAAKHNRMLVSRIKNRKS